MDLLGKLLDAPLLHGYLLMKTNVVPWVDWRLKDDARYIYALSWNGAIILPITWSIKCVECVCKSNAGGWQILQRGWHLHLPLHAKVFIWTIIINGLSLSLTLRRRGLGSGMWFFCTIPLEDNTHRFIKCSVLLIIQKYSMEIWQILTHCYLRPQHWVLLKIFQNGPNDDLKILL